MASGVILGSVIWATAAVLGLQLLLTRAAAIYRLIEIAGGIYLCFIGTQVFRHAAAPLPEVQELRADRAAAFRKGLLLNLSNPKVVVFFGTVFAALFNAQTPPSERWLAILIVFFDETLWYVTLATAFGSAPVRRVYTKIKTPAERIFGAFSASLARGSCGAAPAFSRDSDQWPG
jgi:threonine/homoserine/homoserine lactone efflux protein